MAHRSRRRLYETAFDSKVEKPVEEGSGDLLDRIANHPILLLLNPRRRRQSNNNNNASKRSTTSADNHNLNTASYNNSPSTARHAYRDEHGLLRQRPATVLPKTKFQGSGTPRCGRRGARARVCPPRSLSSHHLVNSSLRPIGLSKSDDQILNRLSDSPDDEDCLEDYVEGRQAEDLARDLITLHLTADEVQRANRPNDGVHTQPNVDKRHAGHGVQAEELSGGRRERLRKGALDRGYSVDGRIDDVASSWDSINDNSQYHQHGSHSKNRNRNERPCHHSSPRASSILALHHPNVSSPRMLHQDRVQPYSGSSSNSSLHHSPLMIHGSFDSSSPRLYHARSNTSSPQQYSYSASPSPKLLSRSTASPKALYNCNTPSPRLLLSSASRGGPHSALSSPRLKHLTSSSNTDACSLSKSNEGRLSLSNSGAIARVLQTDCMSAPTSSSHLSSSQGKSKLSIDEPSTSGYSSSRVSPSVKSSLRDLKRSEGLAKLKPLELLHSPPGTAPLPVKFIKKPPLSDRSPSSWFSPPRQKDLSLPVKRTSQSRSSSSDASTSDGGGLPSNKVRVKKGATSARATKLQLTSDADTSAVNSDASLNSSMEVLVDAMSECGLSLPTPSTGKTSTLSLESMVSGTSSMESLRSSVSEGAGAGGWRNMGSNSSLPLRPSLLLPATHRSLIQSAKFQILSPISDKSQEPSSSDTGGPIVGGMVGIVGGSSPHTSPPHILQQTPAHNRNISEDFRNVHHIIPGPLSNNKGRPGESDSGISIEYGTAPPPPQHCATSPAALKDLPFDMPKLRRRLAAARSCPSTSNSSITSLGDKGPALNPALSRVVHNQSSNSSTTSLGGGSHQPTCGGGYQPTATNPAISRVQASEVSGNSSSNSSVWEEGSSVGSSNEGTPRRTSADGSAEGTPRKASLSARGSLVLELGIRTLTSKGEEVDVSVPLTKQSWYHGKINRVEAEDLLRCETEGSYLVRSLDTPRMEYSLALKATCGFMHLKIQYLNESNGFKMGRGDQIFPSIPHIINHHAVHRLPIKGAEHMFLMRPLISETL